MVHFDTLDGGRSINKFPSDTKKNKENEDIFSKPKNLFEFLSP